MILNILALLGLGLIRFGERAGGIVFMLFGLAIVAVVAWALTRPIRNAPTKE